MLHALLLALLAGSSYAGVEKGAIKAPTGRIDYIVDAPRGGGPFPLLVVAPAKQLLMEAPLFEKLAKGAAKQGYFVVRFNWRFVASGTQPTPDLSGEATDIDIVVDRFLQERRVDRGRIVLAAKSLGSRALMRGPEKRAKALLLLTPNCDGGQTFRQLYAPLFDPDKPRTAHIAISATDPYCDVRQIYSALGELGSRVTVHTLAGGHNFESKLDREGLNADAAIAGGLAWLAGQK